MSGISEKKKFFTTEELKRLGYSYYRIGRLEEKGLLSRVNRNTYENLSYSGDENDFFSAEAYVRGGVVCLLSAARYYGLTNFLPDRVDVAIERSRKVSTLPSWPEISIYYFDSSRMENGVLEIHEGENSFHIFDIEKTVVDVVYYRNKVGIEETKEILNNYLKRKDRHIDRLFEYAKILRTGSIFRIYMEMLM